MTGNATEARAVAQPPRSKHVLVVKMFLAITVCYFAAFTSLNLVFVFGLDDRWIYLNFINNINNPVIYYWLNK